MEIRIVVSDAYAAEFSAGGGFVPSNKMEAGPIAGDAPLTSTGSTTGYALVFPSSCVAEATEAVPGRSRLKRTQFRATFLPDHEAQPNGPPRRLCVVVGRDPASSNAVVRHNLQQGPLLSRRHCALRMWFPRTLRHPSIGSSTTRNNVLLAMDCIDFGSMNGTFVDTRRIPATSLPCKPMLVDVEALLASPNGVHVASLSFGTGSKLQEGGVLQPNQERLRFDVLVRMATQQVPLQGVMPLLPTCGEELITMLFKDVLPVTEIDMPRSSLLAAASCAALKGNNEKANATDIAPNIARLTGASDERLMGDDAVSMATRRSAVTMADSPTRQSRASLIMAPTLSSKSAAVLGGGTSMNKLHSRHFTDDVLSGILKDHGYGSSSRKVMEAALQTVDAQYGAPLDAATNDMNAGASHHEDRNDAVVGVVALDTADIDPVPGVPEPSSEGGALAAPDAVPPPANDADDQQCAVLVCRRGAAPRINRASSSAAVAPILLESDVVADGSSAAEGSFQKRQVHQPQNGVLTSSLPTSQLSQALPGDEATHAAKHVELVDTPVDTAHQLLPKKKTPPTTDGASDAKKKGGRPKRVVDPTETISRFCEALKADQPPPKKSDQHHSDHRGDDGHAMAKSLKASLCFVQDMQHRNEGVPKQATVAPPPKCGRGGTRIADEVAADDDDDDDIPLGMLLLRGGGRTEEGHSSSVIVAESHHGPSATGTAAASMPLHSLPIPPSDNTATGSKGQGPTGLSLAAAREGSPLQSEGMHHEAWCQLDDFIASQMSGDLNNMVDNSDNDSGNDNMGRPGGCVMIAGRSAHPPNDAPPAPVDRTSASQSKQRNETLRCLFDEEGLDESVESMDADHSSADGRGGSPHGAVEKRYFESLGRATTSSSIKHLSSLHGVGPSNRRVHPMVAVLGGGNSTESVAANGMVAEGHKLVQAPAGHQRSLPNDARAHAMEGTPTRNAASTFSSDGSCATWKSSPQDLTLIASQMPLQLDHDHATNKGRADTSTQPMFQSQMEITRNPVRRYALGSVLHHLDASFHRQRASERVAQTEDTAKKHRRVSFNPTVSTVDLVPAASPGPQNLHTSPPKRSRPPSAAELRRARLEAVLNVLPRATADDITQSEEVSADAVRPAATDDGQHAFAGWTRTLSHLAEDALPMDGTTAEDFADASTRVVYAPQAVSGGEVDIAVYASVQLRGVLKTHQWEALQFMWRCLMLEASPASGAKANKSNAKVRPRDETIATAAMKSSLKRARLEDGPSDKKSVATTAAAASEEHSGNAFDQRASTHFDFSLDGDGVARQKEDHEVVHRPRGCVLAHAMGLGKSLTVIGFLFTLWRHISRHGFSRLSSSSAWSGAPWLRSLLRTGGGARVVVCVPKALAFHWVREVHQWSVAMDEEAVTIYLLSQDTRSDKLSLLKEWAAEGSQSTGASVGKDEATAGASGGVSFPRSILLVTHSTFTSMMMSEEDAQGGSAKGKPKRPAKRKKKKVVDDDDGFWFEEDEGAQEEEEALDERNAQRLAARLEHLKQCRAVLLSVTNCLIVDEVHRLQNPTTRLARSACQFRSPGVMKVALTGTPVTSNSRDELLAVMQFVMPSLWTKRDLSDRALMAEMTRFVHRRGMETLAAELPNIVEHTIVVRMSPTQGQLFRSLIQWEQEHGVVPPRKLLETVSRTMLISNHTDLVADWCRRRGVVTSHQENIPNDARWAVPALDAPSIFDEPPSQGSTAEDNLPLAAHPAGESLEHSWKMRTLLAILQRSLGCGEKVVVFSHSIKTLYLVGRLLTILFDLHDAEEFALLDGRIPSSARDDLTARFNDPNGSLCLLLLSFQSNSIGHNFTGAQRVILFEASWRPVIDLQAVCRVFRFGQRHTVFVNRLVSQNGIEERMLSQLQATTPSSSSNSATAKTTARPSTRSKGPGGSASHAVPINTPVGAEELLRSLLVASDKKRSSSGRFIDCDGIDPVLGEIVSSASSIASVIRDRSFARREDGGPQSS